MMKVDNFPIIEAKVLQDFSPKTRIITKHVVIAGTMYR